jgi:prepilin-type N-terminal cleavage/methylation domain-containing protein
LKQLGLTLFEIMIVLMIAGILLAIAVPSYQIFVKKSSQQVLSSQLLRAIELTRHEAIAKGVPVTLCKTENQTACGGDWQSGYLVKTDEHVLYAFRNQTHEGKIYWRGSFGDEALQFSPSGFSDAENGTFWFCEKDEKNPAWAIVVNQAGLSRLLSQNARGKIIDDHGVALKCIMR